MKVEIKLFAVAKQLAGAETIDVEIADQATVSQLRDAIAEQHPELSDLAARAMIAVNTEYVSNEVALPAQAEIAIIPPVSGG